MASQVRAPNIDISAVVLQPAVRANLIKFGFKMTSDFVGLQPSQLSREAHISVRDAADVLRAINTGPTVRSGGRSALELLQALDGNKHIITFCSDMDTMLGGGIPLGEVTEFCGAPGIGKTQLGIQLAVDVHLPTSFGGIQGEAVYIDTEGSFMEERAKDIASAFVSHVQRMVSLRGGDDFDEGTRDDFEEGTRNLSVGSVLSTIHVYRVHDWVEQIAVVTRLEQFLNEHPQVKLVVIDSVAFQFRCDFKDYAMRARLLTGSAQRLTELAKSRNIAVVLMNQVTTKIGDRGSSSFLAPALGETWAHACTNRIMLYWQDGQRYARLYKSPSRKSDIVAYLVTQEGVRGLPKKRSRRSRQGSTQDRAD